MAVLQPATFRDRQLSHLEHFLENHQQDGRSYCREVIQSFDNELCGTAAEQQEVGDVTVSFFGFGVFQTSKTGLLRVV